MLFLKWAHCALRAQRRGSQPKWKVQEEERIQGRLPRSYIGNEYSEAKSIWQEKGGMIKKEAEKERMNDFIFSSCQSILASCPGFTTCQLKFNWKKSLIKRLIVTQIPISGGKIHHLCRLLLFWHLEKSCLLAKCRYLQQTYFQYSGSF